MIETDIRTFLIPTTSSIPSIGSRFYLNSLPDTVTYPCAIMFSVSRNEIHEAEFYTERFQFSCYADYKSSAQEIADAIKTKLKRFFGNMSTSSTYTIRSAAVENLVFIVYNILKYERQRY